MIYMAIPPQLVDFKMTFVRLYLIPADFSFLQRVKAGAGCKVSWPFAYSLIFADVSYRSKGLTTSKIRNRHHLCQQVLLAPLRSSHMKRRNCCSFALPVDILCHKIFSIEHYSLITINFILCSFIRKSAWRWYDWAEFITTSLAGARCSDLVKEYNVI